MPALPGCCCWTEAKGVLAPHVGIADTGEPLHPSLTTKLKDLIAK